MAMHSTVLAVGTSGQVLALSKGSVMLSTPPVGAWEEHGHGVTSSARPAAEVCDLGCHETAIAPLLVDAQGKGSSSINLSQPLLDPAIFLSG